MTREEAVTVLEAFIENPLFSNTHKAAFNIAIHDIKQRHDWDINNLILINKENYEPIDREVLDKIIAEIKEEIEQEEFARSVFRGEEKDAVKAEQCTGSIMAYNNVIKLIDKYMAERSE